MEAVISTAIVCLLVAVALFFSVRKLWRDKKNGKTCCGGDCSCCGGCSEKKENLKA